MHALTVHPPARPDVVVSSPSALHVPQPPSPLGLAGRDLPQARGAVQGPAPFQEPEASRLTRATVVLNHPRRQRLLAHVLERGAVGPREAARATGIPPTAALHHLVQLKRHGLVLETRAGVRILFHAPQQAPLPSFPGWSILHTWIAQNPEQRQKAILAAMQGHGWPRSTTQHRLRRVLAAGLVELNRRTYRARAVHVPHLRLTCTSPITPFRKPTAPFSATDAPRVSGTYQNKKTRLT
jgi:hypothetical protein